MLINTTVNKKPLRSEVVFKLSAYVNNDYITAAIPFSSMIFKRRNAAP